MKNRNKAINANCLAKLPKVGIERVDKVLEDISLDSIQKMSYQDAMNTQYDIKHNMAFLDEVIAHLKITYKQTSEHYYFIYLIDNLITTGLKLKIAAQTEYRAITRNGS